MKSLNQTLNNNLIISTLFGYWISVYDNVTYETDITKVIQIVNKKHSFLDNDLIYNIDLFNTRF